MRQYFIEGFFSLVKIFPVALIAYAVIFFLIWLIKKRKPQIKLIPKYVCEYLLVLWCSEILNITGIIGMEICNIPTLGDLVYPFTKFPFAGASFTMVLLNFLLFVPIGIILPVAVKSEKWRFYKALIIGAGFSAAIEITQIFAGRMFEIDDIISNTLGVLAGYFIWRSIHEIRADKKTLIGSTGIVLTVFISAVILWGISFIADGEAVSERLMSEYGGIEDDTGTFENIKSIIASIDGAEREVTDSNLFQTDKYFNYMDIYSSVATEITNNVWAYEFEETNTTSDEIINDLKLPIVEIVYKTPHAFKFYNNQDFEMDNVGCIVFNIYSGDFWYGPNEDNLTSKMLYGSTQYPYIASENLINNINEVLK